MLKVPKRTKHGFEVLPKKIHTIHGIKLSLNNLRNITEKNHCNYVKKCEDSPRERWKFHHFGCYKQIKKTLEFLQGMENELGGRWEKKKTQPHTDENNQNNKEKYHCLELCWLKEEHNWFLNGQDYTIPRDPLLTRNSVTSILLHGHVLWRFSRNHCIRKTSYDCLVICRMKHWHISR